MLSYAFAKERIISTEPTFADGLNLDYLYLDKSIRLESDLTLLKSKYDSILKPVMSLINIMDSKKFCGAIIGDSLANETVTEFDSIAPGFQLG
jgi:hypothetical protein